MSENKSIATELDGRVDFTFDAIIVEAEAPGSNNFNQYLDELSRRIAEFAQNRSNIHNALDLLGYAPGVGSFADLANAGLYLYEGNYKESLYSGLAAAPGMGDVFAAARTAKRVENTVQGLRKAVSGKWVQVSESMSDASRAYQRQITGTDQVWLQNGVKFDGIKDGVLIEAKGSYSNFVNKNTGKFQDWFTGQESLISQANRQLRASEGMPINWYFADEASMKAAQRLFQERRISGINFILKPLE